MTQNSLDVKYVYVLMSVELLEVFGDDLTIINDSIRVAFRDEIYSIDHNFMPTIQPQVRFKIKMPLFVARMWFRDDVGFVRNESTDTYMIDDTNFWVPKKLYKQSSDNEKIQYNGHCIAKIQNHNKACMTLYRDLIDHGVTFDQARSVLPQSMMVEFIELGTLASYARLYKLRTLFESHIEIREITKTIGNILAEKFPISWIALTSYDDRPSSPA